MTDVMQGLVSEAKKNKFSTIGSSLSDEDVASVWDNVSGFVEKQMSQQKGVNIPGLGTFTFSQKKLDVGNNKYILIQRPVFLLSEKFAQTHGLHNTKHHVSGQIPVVQLNFAALSFESPFDRDSVEACVKEVLNALQRSVSCKKNVEFAFNGIGRLHIRDSKVKMKFYKEFINTMDGSGRLVQALKDRPGTMDSVMSDRAPSRPHTSNTLVLPRISGQLGLVPEDNAPGGSHQLMPAILEEDAGEAFQHVDDDYPKLDDPQEGAYMDVLDDKDILAEVEVYEDKRSPVPPATGRPGSRVAVPVAKAMGVSFHDDLKPTGLQSPKGLRGVSVLSKSSPTPLKRSLSPIYSPPTPRVEGASPGDDMTRSRSGDGFLRRPVPLHVPRAPGNHVTDGRPNTTGSCGHANAGQELCYLCHQRSRRNIPVSFTEERRRREEEEDKLLQQYQHMKDTDAILNEQEQLLGKHHTNQKIAAFNLGVSEAIKSKMYARDTNFHSSYIFQKRPLTPPRFIKQDLYSKDLGDQVTSKCDAQKKRNADEEFLERLEQVQLAEDLASQREQYLRGKMDQQDQYKRALSAQLRYKPNPIPARVSDSSEPIFGKNDMNNEKMLERRRNAHELYQEQLGIVEQRKREAILKRLQDQKDEESMLKNTKHELVNDRAERYDRLFTNRKCLEDDWFKAVDTKKKKESDERLHTRSAGMLLHEQCDKYDRCDQCKRRLPNCGESNIWRESRYIPGSRLMV